MCGYLRAHISMKKSEYFLKSLVNAAGVLVYVSAIAWMLFNGEMIFGKASNFLMPLLLLLLFIVSASITGLLVLGKPIHLYLSGLKKEAFILLFATLGWLVVFLIAVVVVLLLRPLSLYVLSSITASFCC